ncbi:nucleotidyltransferase [Aliarcobacter butzleri L353]|uniref:SMODS domain-containing nucleotidyltransferase n=1 Tax=Aliarcobacter butzleri TaxID=28197 RepID=UPI000657E971|nr:nucleotidyltransferase [Aliarcobacter butzleri]KLE05815.1 nucleotidyltransferase [Aliarcobacter butzleri L353]
MNVSSTFQEFLQNLAIDNKEEISNRYGEITKVLNIKYRNTESKTSNSLQVGSYGRFTAIKNISDLDMVYILPWTEYERFKNDRQSALLQEVKKTIQSRYPKTDVRGDGQVVVISFTNYQIEVLPAFENSDGSFLYPDTNNGGSWKTTKPRLEIKAISDLHQAKNQNLRTLCKMIRSWKNYHGVAMGGLLIDSVAYNFLNSTTYFDDKSFTYYDWLIRDFLKYLSDLQNTNHVFAPGSNQKVYIKKKFQTRAKKAHKLVLEAIEAQENKNANQKWKKIFGRNFPSAVQLTTEVMDKSIATWTNTEEFIEDKYNVDIRYDLSIDCEVTQAGFRTDNLLSILASKIRLLPNKELKFQIIHNDVKGDFEIYWKVLNRGDEAQKRNMIRGQIVKGSSIKKEKTNFRGDHIVECYIVQNNIVVAKDRIHVPISEGVY